MSERRDGAYAFFRNRACEYFPCHEGVDAESFNCLFCWCPLYTLGEDCGGCYRYTPEGVKDCSRCTLPHEPAGYDRIVEKFDEIKALAAQKEKGKEQS